MGRGVAISGTSGVTTYLILERNRIVANYVNADSTWGDGAGVDITYAMFRIVGNVFERDTVVGQTFAVAGAIGIFGGSFAGPVDGLIQNNVFRRNIVDATTRNGVGGSMYFYATGPVSVTANLFEGNIAKSRDGYGEGGGLLFEDTGVSGYGRKLVVGNRFVGNRSSSQNLIGTGGGIELFNTLATVSGNYFADNSVEGGASSGGAIRIWRSSFRLENNILTQNSSGNGGGIYVSGAPQSGIGQEIINNTIANNTASSSGGGISEDNSQTTVKNSILWGNTPDQISGASDVTYSDVQGGWPAIGNINANPLFADSTRFYLSSSSPCIDAGNPSSSFNDPQDPLNPGYALFPAMGLLRNDMGAYGGPGAGIIVNVRESERETYLPTSFVLYQNYPNPFNPSTKIGFNIPTAGFTTLTVYDVLGREVATLVNEEVKPGSYHVEWNASSFASGVYLYRLRAGSFTETRKLLLLR